MSTREEKKVWEKRGKRVSIRVGSLTFVVLCACSSAPPAEPIAKGLVQMEGSTSIRAELPPGTVAVGPVFNEATADAYIEQAPPNRNHGGDAVLSIRGPGNHRALVQAPITVTQYPAGSGLLEAKLQLNIGSIAGNWGSGQEIAVHRMTREWADTGVTWNCSVDTQADDDAKDCAPDPTFGPWEMGKHASSDELPYIEAPTATATVTSDMTEILFDVTADVALFQSGEAPNYGWLIKMVDERGSASLDVFSLETGSGPGVLVTTYKPLVPKICRVVPWVGHPLPNFSCIDFCRLAPTRHPVTGLPCILGTYSPANQTCTCSTL